jgi:DNA-directed RNA polymerase specialized sigma subunit
MNKAAIERTIENHLRFYNTYRIGIRNCIDQLDYIMPSLVTRYEVNSDSGESFWIVNNTEKVALDRIESKRALDLREEIERFKLITSAIERALEDLNDNEKRFVILRYFECKPINVVSAALGYAEEKSVYRIRRHVLDKLIISLKSITIL